MGGEWHVVGKGVWLRKGCGAKWVGWRHLEVSYTQLLYSTRVLRHEDNTAINPDHGRVWQVRYSFQI